VSQEPRIRRPAEARMLPRWLKLLLAVVALLFGLAGLVWVVADVVTRAKLKELQAEMRAEGWPMSYAELAPEPVPDEKNAALLYVRAYAGLRGPAEKEMHELWDQVWEQCKELPNARWEVLPASLQERVRSFIARRGEVLEMLSVAARMPRCRLPIEYCDPYPCEAKDFPRFYVLADLLWLAGFVALGDGHPEEAFERWFTLVAMARHLEGHNLEDTELYRLACLVRALPFLESLVQSGSLTKEQVGTALRAWQDVEAKEGSVMGARSRWLARKLLFEPASRKTFFAEFHMEPDWGSLGWFYDSWLAGPWRQYELAYCIDEMRQDAERVEARPFRRWNTPRQLFPLLPPPQGRYGDGRIMWEIGPGLVEGFTISEARIKLARAALALEEYRLTHGEYPATLDVLVPDILPEVPLDPFDGKPVRYLKDGERVLVYSVGPNLQDDGGEVGENDSELLDIVFTLRPGAKTEGSDR
jgi:hypothetical protein